MKKFEIIKDEKGCKELWNKFSPNEILWDLWDFRHCFHNKNFDFHFIACAENSKITGLMPLVYDKSNKHYTYFGGWFPEQNRFFLEDKKKLALFLEKCPKNTKISYIKKSEKDFYNFTSDEKRYFLNFVKYSSNNDLLPNLRVLENSKFAKQILFDNYLKTFTKKHRKNFRYDLKKLKEKNYAIKINNVEDFSKLIEFNKQRFGEKSDYHDKIFVESMKKLMESAQKKNVLHMMSVMFNEKTEAVGLGVIYNKVYYVIGIGRNVEIENLGKLLIFEQIMNALEQNCNEIDFLSTESGWKELWNLDSEQMYKFVK